MTVDEALNMKFVEMKVPDFLLAEDPFGYKRPELYVQYIYSPSYLSFSYPCIIISILFLIIK
jgi:hypothetical protein